MSSRSYARICFRFSTYKNRNTGVARPVASQAGCTYVFSLFRLQKLQHQGSSFIRPVARIYFCFSICKNCKAGAAMPAASQVGCTYLFLLFCS